MILRLWRFVLIAFAIATAVLVVTTPPNDIETAPHDLTNFVVVMLPAVVAANLLRLVGMWWRHHLARRPTTIG